MNEQQLKQLFGKRVKEIRKSRRLTQEKLAELIEMDTHHLCRMENGTHFPKIKNLAKLISVLDIDIKDLFTYNESENIDVTTEKVNTEIKKLSEKELKFIYQIIIAIMELRK